jgi:lipooligosaccharide transport system ATP-binding protein
MVAQLVVDDLDDLLTGSEALREIHPDQLVANSRHEVPDDAQVDVRLQQGQADLAQGFVDVGFAQAAAAAQPAEDRVEAVGKGLEHAVYQRRPPTPGRLSRPQITSVRPGADRIETQRAREPLIYARGLTKTFGSLRAVDAVDFSVTRGEAFGFLGPNGAGKSSTMRMIAAVSPRSGGDLRVLGLDPDRDGPTIRGRLGVVPQEDNLDLELTVRENLYVYGRYFDLPRRELRARIERLLDFAQLSERADDRVEPLSGGMKRRLTIARSLVNEPDLLLLDEPTTGLDPQARHALWDRLYRLKAEGVTLVLTTHYMDEAEQLCDRLVVMEGGRIAAEGSPRELIDRYCTREVVELRFGPGESERMAAKLTGLDGRVTERIEVLPDRLLLYTDEGDAAVGGGRSTPPRASQRPRPARHAGRRVPATHRPPPGGLTRHGHSPDVASRRLLRPRLPAHLAGVDHDHLREPGPVPGGHGRRARLVHQQGRPHRALGHLSYLQFVAPALAATTAAMTAASESMFPVMGAIRWTRTYFGMLATPLRVGDVLARHLLWIATRVATAVSAYLIVMAAFGTTPSIETWPSCQRACWSGWRSRRHWRRSRPARRMSRRSPLVFRLGVIPLFLFSGVFFPISQLPLALRVIATPLRCGTAWTCAGNLPSDASPPPGLPSTCCSCRRWPQLGVPRQRTFQEPVADVSSRALPAASCRRDVRAGPGRPPHRAQRSWWPGKVWWVPCQGFFEPVFYLLSIGIGTRQARRADTGATPHHHRRTPPTWPPPSSPRLP